MYTIKVDNVTAERKTADNLLQLVEDAIKEVEETWGSKVVAVVTDASGECRKAQCELVRKYPWLIVLDCFTHQVSFKVNLS